MNNEFYIGMERGIGIAKIQFLKKFPELHKKINSNKNLIPNFPKTYFEKLDTLGIDFTKSPSLGYICLKLFQVLEIGGICISKKTILEESNENQIPISEEEINEYLKTESSILVEDFESYYFKKNYLLEEKISELILKRFFVQKNFKSKIFHSDFLSNEQLEIVNQILNFSFSILSGGPGTGKTKMIQSIIENAVANKIQPSKIALLCPTGKASKRLNESIKELFSKLEGLEEAKTIHRYLEFSNRKNSFKRNEYNLVSDELIILDESSMIDMELMESLLKAIPLNKKISLVLVGDPNQLLSLNKGAVFNDLCKLGKNHFKLSKTFRQKDEGKEILEFSKTILVESGFEKFIEKKDKNFSEGVNFHEIESESDLENSISIWIDIIQKLTSDFQILSPFHDSNFGTIKMNEFLYKGETKYKAILNSNLYEYNIFNGEIGKISLGENKFQFKTNEQEIILPNSYLDFFDLGSVISIHKSQGSEYEHVLILLPFESASNLGNLSRRMIYTAVTRAKKSVCIFGKKEIFFQIIEKKEEQRYSNIEKRIKPLLLK